MHSLCILLLLAACSAQSEPFSESDRIVVRFSLSGIQAEVSTRAGGNGTSPLAEGTTLRILAFKRVNTATPDFSQDKYMGEATYTVGRNGLSSESPLLLLAGTYDFYALTPDLEVNKTGNSYTVSINHGVDYASSLTAAVTVTEDNPSVTLTALTRHCSRLIFNFSPKYDNVTSVEIHSAELTNMTNAPVVGALNTSLPIESVGKTASVTLGSKDFTSVAGKPLESSASAIVLPRQAGVFDFKMVAYFNGSTTETTCSASLPVDLAFQPGYQYIFTIKMKGDAAELELAVEPWDKEHSLDMDIGG